MLERTIDLFVASAAEKDPVKIAIMERKLFMIKYGYISEKDSFSAHGRYNTQLKDCFHPWAGKIVGETFGSREYGKLIPIKDYLSMPVDIIDDILEGIAIGEDKNLKAKQKAAEQAARKFGNNDPHLAAINHALKEK